MRNREQSSDQHLISSYGLESTKPRLQGVMRPATPMEWRAIFGPSAQDLNSFKSGTCSHLKLLFQAVSSIAFGIPAPSPNHSPATLSARHSSQRHLFADCVQQLSNGTLESDRAALTSGEQEGRTVQWKVRLPISQWCVVHRYRDQPMRCPSRGSAPKELSKTQTLDRFAAA